MKAKWILAFFLILTSCATASRSPAALSGIDSFGSKRLKSKDVSKIYGPRLENWLKAVRNSNPHSESQRESIEAEIKAKFDFAYVSIAVTSYFGPVFGDYITVDVVEKADASIRMNFLPPPQKNFEDPDGLIALWETYQEAAFEILKSGKSEPLKSCPVWHCLLGFEHPKLAPFLSQFNQLVPKNEKKLVQILNEDSRPLFRTNAIYLLAHIPDGNSVIQYALKSSRDSSSAVRNSSVRVLGEIARKHPKFEIPVEPLLQVLNFPHSTDRNKAANSLWPLSLKKKNQKVILTQAGGILIEMLKLQQPNNREPAYAILKILSGQDFGEHNHSAWEEWLGSQEGATEP